MNLLTHHRHHITQQSTNHHHHRIIHSFGGGGGDDTPHPFITHHRPTSPLLLNCQLLLPSVPTVLTHRRRHFTQTAPAAASINSRQLRRSKSPTRLSKHRKSASPDAQRSSEAGARRGDGATPAKGKASEFAQSASSTAETPELTVEIEKTVAQLFNVEQQLEALTPRGEAARERAADSRCVTKWLL